MGVYAQAVRLGLAAIAVVALAGCDRPKFRGEQAPPAAPASQPAAEPLPAQPAWAAELIGKPLRPTFPGDAECVGNTDVVEKRYPGAGAKIVGWGWDPAAKTPVQRVVLVDQSYVIVGAGETGLDRPDVPAARPEITSRTTGWSAVAKLPAGAIDTFGVLADGKSVCKLGHIEF